MQCNISSVGSARVAASPRPARTRLSQRHALITRHARRPQRVAASPGSIDGDDELLPDNIEQSVPTGVANGQAVLGEGGGSATTTGTTPPTASASASASASGSPEDAEAKRAAEVLEETRLFLYTELVQLFETGRLTEARYAPGMAFEDPLVRLSGLAGYQLNIQAIRTVFDIDFTVHSVAKTAPDELTARWTMRCAFKLAPWRPEATFTGTSAYRVALPSGQLLSQKDVWDALGDNAFPSAEAYAYVAELLFTVRLTPSLETPRYNVLRKARAYEVRRYDRFVVAETSMPPRTAGGGLAAGEGFQRLAGFIFGGNASSTKMEMTTPVFTSSSGEMQFPLEEKFGADPTTMPAPNDPTVSCAVHEEGVVAAAAFPGLALDWEVQAVERALRGALLLDGLQPLPGWELAQYNDPFTPPWWRRNEVLIRLGAPADQLVAVEGAL